MKIHLILMLIICCPALLFAADKYVTVNPASLQTVNGTTLLAVSYLIVLGMLAFYWGHMIIQSKKTTRQIERLEQDINNLKK